MTFAHPIQQSIVSAQHPCGVARHTGVVSTIPHEDLWNKGELIKIRVKDNPPHLRRRRRLSNPSFVSEKEPWTRTESPDRRRRSRAQSRRWSAGRRAMPSSKPKEKPTRLKTRVRTASAASKTCSNQQLRRG